MLPRWTGSESVVQFSMRKLLVLLLLCATGASAQEEGNPTAYEALRVVGTKHGRAALSRIVSVTGMHGTPQPETWNVLLEDSRAPGGVREVEVKNGRIRAQRTPTRSIAGSTENALIKTARLNLDSSGAYEVAAYTARHTSFATASYTLRTDDRGNPVWIVVLHDERDRQIAKMHIGANRGTVTRTEGLFAPPTPQGGEEAPDDQRLAQRDNGNQDEYDDAYGAAAEDEEYVEGEEAEQDLDDDEDNPITRGVKSIFRQAQEGARRIFHNARRSFEDFINRH